MLDLRRLAVLVSVARAGSLTAAGEELGVTQPAIGQQLRALEAQCGMSLVVRSGRGVRLTAAGTLLANRAMPILAAIGDIEDELLALQRGVSGTVSIEATPGVFDWLVGPAAAMARRSVPDLRIELSELTMEGPAPPLEALLRGDCDIAVTPEGTDGLEWPDVHATLLVEAATVVVVRSDHALAAESAVPWSRLGHETVLTSVDQALALGHTFFRTASHPVTVLSDPGAILRLVESGFGVALLPDVRPVPSRDLVKLPMEEGVVVRYHAAVRRHFEPTATMRAVVNSLLSVATEAVDGTRTVREIAGSARALPSPQAP